jgi:hypothetical protein
VTFDFFRTASRWLFFAALVVAPWFYGGTTAVSIVAINWVLGASLLLWVIELSVNRRRPIWPKLLLLLIAALLAIGIWMTINSRSIYDAEFGTFTSLTNFAPRAPGSVDYAISLAWLVRGILLLMSILFVVDLSRSERALLQLWQVIVIAGGSISLLGLLQKATGAQAIFWQMPGWQYATNFFASYYYHANAGAYLNLILPLSAGLALRAFGTESSAGARALWLIMFLLNLAAIAANTSRMAQLIGVLTVIALVWQLGPRLYRRLSGSERNVALGGAAAIFLAIYAIAQTTHLEQPLHRWEKLGEQITTDARLSASRVAVRALPEAGALGFGPGTFRAVFPSLNKNANNLAGTGVWRFLHQDYLQTVIEWGWVGSALWAALLFGGIAVALVAVRAQRAIRRGAPRKTEKLKTEKRKSENSISASQRFSVSKEWSWRRRLILPLAIIALAGVALHAIVDFPLQIESIQLYAATYLALCWASARW